MAEDSNMVHICIYIFTINHSLSTFKKNKQKKTTLRNLVVFVRNGPEASPRAGGGIRPVIIAKLF